MQKLKAQTSVVPVVALIIGIIVGMYILSATFDPIQGAATTLSVQMGQPVTGENLGAANSTGFGTFYTANVPVQASTWTVYANGTASAAWVNSTVAVTLASGQVVVAATGTNPTTAGAVITMSYSRNSGITGMQALSGLPGVAVLLFVLFVIVGFIYMAVQEK